MFYYLEHNEINLHKWDLAVANSHCANVFQFYWYLNLATNNQWAAIVEDDYKSVMPLPYIQKFKKKILLHDGLIPYLAICSDTFINPIKSSQIFELLRKNFIKAKFVLYKYISNPSNSPLKTHNLKYFSKDLIYTYDKILSTYSNFALHQIAKSKREGFYFNNLIKIKGIIKFLISENFSNQLNKIESLKNIMLIAQDKHLLYIDAIYDKISSLNGIAVYLTYKKTATLLVLHTKYNLPENKKLMIKLALIDHFINLNSQKNFKLDVYPWLINHKDSIFLDFLGFKTYLLQEIEFKQKLPFLSRFI